MMRWNYFLALLLLLIGCSDDPAPTSPAPVTVDTLPPAPRAPSQRGQIIPDWPLPGTPETRLALYLPPREQATYPLAVALDPQGEAQVPLELYRELAEEKGWILAGVYNSKNGQPGQQNVQYAEQAIDFLKENYAVDPQRIYLLGFSGGARTAYVAAAQRPDIAGVVACAAGYAPQAGERGFSVYGLVGDADFNYLEMDQLQMAFDAAGKPNWVEVYEGGHAWPPVEEMQQAWEWLEFRGMAYGALVKDSVRLAAKRAELQEERRGMDAAEKARSLREEMSWFRDLADAEALRAQLQELKKDYRYREGMQAIRQRMDQEIKLRQDYQFEVQTKGLDHWKQEAPRLRKLGRQPGPEGKMYQRIVNFLSITCYSYTYQFLEQEDLPNAEIFARIYALIDPSNPEPALIQAKIAGRRQQPEAALEALQSARELGFDQPDRLVSDPDLAPIHGRREFRAMVDSMSALVSTLPPNP